MKTVAIIQARMNSSRLPGKVLQDICGQTMLVRVVERVAQCREVDEVIVATTTHPHDDPIVAACKQAGVFFFRGSEDDVLSRYLGAAQATAADFIVRICSDSPLVDPEVSDELIGVFKAQWPAFDFASNHAPRTYPLGLDTQVFSYDALLRSASLATQDYEKAHVSIYMYEHPDEFRILNCGSDTDYSRHRWTVDTGEDLAFVRAIYQRLGDAKRFSWRDVLKLVDETPALATINAHIEQKIVTLG